MKSKHSGHATSSVRVPIADHVGLDPKEALRQDLNRVRSLLESGDVEEARAWVKELERKWPESDQVRHYVRVLAPPQVAVRHGERGRSRHQERAWLREHAREYPGQWLAVLGDQLIAANSDLSIVLAAVRQTPGAQRALIHFSVKSPHPALARTASPSAPPVHTSPRCPG